MKHSLFKNHVHFIRNYWANKKFFNELYELVKKWSSPYQKNPLGYFLNNHSRNQIELNKNQKQASDQRIAFIKMLGKDATELHKDVLNFLGKNNLGKEWFLTITDYVISGWFWPPIFNLHIDEVGDVHGYKRVVLILNSDTTVDDIKEAWPFIHRKQKEIGSLFPKKQKKVSEKTIKNLEIAVQDKKIKLFGPKKEYDCIKNDTYTLKDLDLVGKFFDSEKNISKEADKKRRNRLRQIRKRMKT